MGGEPINVYTDGRAKTMRVEGEGGDKVPVYWDQSCKVEVDNPITLDGPAQLTLYFKPGRYTVRGYGDNGWRSVTEFVVGPEAREMLRGRLDDGP